MTNKRKILIFLPLQPLTVLALKAGLFIVCLQLSALWITVSEKFAINPVFVRYYYAPAIEYVALSLTVVLFFTMVLEISLRYIKQDT